MIIPTYGQLLTITMMVCDIQTGFKNETNNIRLPCYKYMYFAPLSVMIISISIIVVFTFAIYHQWKFSIIAKNIKHSYYYTLEFDYNALEYIKHAKRIVCSIIWLQADFSYCREVSISHYKQVLATPGRW